MRFIYHHTTAYVKSPKEINCGCWKLLRTKGECQVKPTKTPFSNWIYSHEHKNIIKTDHSNENGKIRTGIDSFQLLQVSRSFKGKMTWPWMQLFHLPLGQDFMSRRNQHFIKYKLLCEPGFRPVRLVLNPKVCLILQSSFQKGLQLWQEHNKAGRSYYFYVGLFLFFSPISTQEKCLANYFSLITSSWTYLPCEHQSTRRGSR